MLTVIAAYAALSAAQTQDPSLNNLELPDGYETAEPGDLQRVVEIGGGPHDAILIAGAGFGPESFEPFAEHFGDLLTSRIVSLPGMDGTQAPPLPEESVGYDQRPWSTAVEHGIAQLIDSEGLEDVYLVANNFVAPQIAVNYAAEHPGQIAGVIVISGEITRGMNFISRSEGAVRSEAATGMADWFRTVTRETWDQGQGGPELYSHDPERAANWYADSIDDPIPVMVQYIVESWAVDFDETARDLQVPMAVFRVNPPEGAFDYVDAIRQIMHDSWNTLEGDRDITMVTLEDTLVGEPLDNPSMIDAEVRAFVAD